MKRCLFCAKKFAQSPDHSALPPGRGAAFDTRRGRLWVICDRCHRWNLWPIEDRAPALESLERLARDRGMPVAETANVSLLKAGSHALVRVGKAGLAERSWWRYGRELDRRRIWYDSTASRVSAYLFGALTYVAESVGLSDMEQKVRLDESGLADIVRWRRFGWAAWRGRERCPNCGSVLRALLYNNSWWLIPQVDEGGFSVGVPCPRCDFAKPENVYKLRGDVAIDTLRRVLAYQHVQGAASGTIEAASRVIQGSGSSEAYCYDVAREQRTLWRLDAVHSVALEIAVNEAAERGVLHTLAREMEFIWEREEELARIIDEELTPREVYARHRLRLPRVREPG